MDFTIVQNDTNPPIESQITDGGVGVDLTNANDVKFHMEDKFEQVVIDDNLSGNVNFVDAANGKVEYVFKSTDTENVGHYQAEWQVEYDNGAIETFPTLDKIDVRIVEEVE